MYVRNVKTVQKGLTKAGAALRAAFVSAVRMEAEAIMLASQRQVPVDTGNLKNSKSVEVKETRDGANITLAYRAEYATFVHEDLDANHVVGNAKFLENPVKAAVPGFGARVRNRVRATVGA